MIKKSDSEYNNVNAKLPACLGADGILVGYSLETIHPKVPFGFQIGGEDDKSEQRLLDPILLVGEGHLLTIAPTGAGKGVSCVIPALLRHKGDIVVMDPKGENYAVTAEFRKSLGQKVVLLDPYGVARRNPGFPTPHFQSISLFEVLPYLSESESAAAESLASMLVGDNTTSVDPFWNTAATNLLSGLIDYYAHEQIYGSLDSLVVELTEYCTDSNDFFSVIQELKHNAARSPELIRLCKTLGVGPSKVIEAYHESKDLLGMIGSNAGSQIERLSELRDTFSNLISIQKATRLNLIDFQEVAKACEVITEYVNTFINKARHIKGRIQSHQSSDNQFRYPKAILRMISSDRQLCQRVSDMVLSTPDKTWGSMLTTLQNNLSFLNSDQVRSCLCASELNWKDFENGTGTTVYIVIPPHRLRTASALPATIFKSLINVLSARTRVPEFSTLFLLDEVAQLGPMEEFVAAKTLLRGYGVQVWSFWQDLSQLKAIYPVIWPTLVNNCKVIQTFGCATPLMASGLNEILDVPANDIIDLEHNEMLLSIYGDQIVTALKPVYYSDPAFAGSFNENSLVRKQSTFSEIEEKLADVPHRVNSTTAGYSTDVGDGCSPEAKPSIHIEIRRAKRFASGMEKFRPKKNNSSQENFRRPNKDGHPFDFDEI